MIRTRRQSKVFWSNFVAIFVPSQKGKVKEHMSRRPKQPELIPVSLAWSKPGSIATPPGWDASPPQGYPPSNKLLVPNYSLGWKDTKWSNNNWGLNPGSPDPEFEVLNTRPHTLPIPCSKSWSLKSPYKPLQYFCYALVSLGYLLWNQSASLVKWIWLPINYMWSDSLEKNNFLEETLVTGHFLQSVANQLISLPIVVLFKLKATAFATRLSLNSIHPSVNSFRPLPPCFFLFFLTATSENENYK